MRHPHRRHLTTSWGSIVLVAAGLLEPLTGAAPKPVKEDPLRVLPPEVDGVPPRNMLRQYLLGQVEAAQRQWQKEYDERKTPEAIQAYQQRLKAKFIDALGGLPERTPLESQVVGQIARDGYRVEKVLFQSQPRHYVTAALFLPDPARHKPPYPGILVPCGHSANGKGMDVYQKACILAALNGLAALIFDPIDQGERHQLLDGVKPRLSGTGGHNMVGVGSILLGRNAARFEIWDGMRAIDYLQSRPEVARDKIGCTGNSGGGTQTAYFMALDDRIVAAAPSCYMCSLYGRLIRSGAQDAEQNIYGQLAWGMDHADYCMMRAPRPTLLCTATHDFFNIEDAWAAYRSAKRLYGRLGNADRMSLVETDEQHGFSLRLREAAVRWMLRWLAGRDEAVFEPENLKPLTDAEIQCTPRGETLLLDGARSVYDLNRDVAAEWAKRRAPRWSAAPTVELLADVRRLAGIRPLEKLPKPKVQTVGSVPRDGYRIDKLILSPEDGIWLPALWFVPAANPAKAPVLYLHEAGKSADAVGWDSVPTSSGTSGAKEASKSPVSDNVGPIVRLVRAGHPVLAVDPRGYGETQQTGQTYFSAALHGPDGQDVYTAYLLGRSYVGMRAEDALVAARWLAEQTPGRTRVELTAVGQATIPALHAAALEPDLFASVRLVRPLVSWTNTVELGYSKTPLASLVHAALTVYDLPELRATLERRGKLTVEQAVDAMGTPLPSSPAARSGG